MTSAAAFECPTKPLEAADAARIKLLLPNGDAFADVSRLNAAVDDLKTEGVLSAILIDKLISAFCGEVATESCLSDAAKITAVMRFAGRVARTVYALQDADEIILDVAFPPSVVDALSERSKASGVSPDSWIRTAVDAALQ
ncbi:hypothetical protein [Kaistia soli]|uniref:hypothetical protein n=1 Tax=Kaistia soli TaxID=446684 RepID=UPI001FCDA66C|nr:hypothetical protein [Kaistia soli]